MASDESVRRGETGRRAGGSEGTIGVRHRGGKAGARVSTITAWPWHVITPVLVGLAVRVLFLRENWHSPFFLVPLVDAEDFHEMAVQLAGGRPLPPAPYGHPPLFTYFVALLYRVFGTDMRVVIVAHQALGLGTIALTSLLGSRLFRPAVGLAAGLLLAVSRLPIILEGQLLNETLQTALLATTMLLMADAVSRRCGRRLFIGAVTGALAVLARPTSALFVVPALAGVALARAGGRGRLEGVYALRRRAVAIAVLAFLGVGGSAAIRNRVVSGEWVAVSYNGGINFFIGNASRHRELINVRPGMRWERLAHTPRALEETGVFQLRPFQDGYAAWDRRYYQAGLADMAADPAAAMRRLLDKTVQFWSAHWIDRNLPPSAFLEPGSMLWRLTLPFGLLAPLSLAGMLLLVGTRHGGRMLIVTAIASVWLTCVIFFVTSRYRMPAYPAFALAAAFLLLRVGENIRAVLQGRGRAGIRGAIAGVLLLLAASVLAWTDLGGAAKIVPARSTYLRGVALERSGDDRRALAAYSKALADAPDDPDILQSTGVLLIRMGQPVRGATHLERAVAVLPDHPLPTFNLGLAYSRLDRHDDAVRAFARLVTIQPNVARYQFNLGKSLVDAGRPEEALTPLDKSIALAPDTPFAWIEKARALMLLGRETEAGRMVGHALELDPSLESDLRTDPEFGRLLR